MNYTKFLLLAFVATAMLMACNQKNASQAQEEKPEEPVTEEPTNMAEPADEKPAKEVYQVVGFQKTACFGKCPVYEVKFFSDGSATWYGRMNTDRMGWHEARLEGKVIKEIKLKADAIGYWKFYQKYPLEHQVADLPTTITMVRVGDMIKTVKNTHDAPEALTEFENYLSEIIEGLAWKPSAKE